MFCLPNDGATNLYVGAKTRRKRRLGATQPKRQFHVSTSSQMCVVVRWSEKSGVYMHCGARTAGWPKF
jgi:hypothetical protein